MDAHLRCTLFHFFKGLGKGDYVVLNAAVNARGFGLIPGCVSVSGDASDPRLEDLRNPFAHRPTRIVP